MAKTFHAWLICTFAFTFVYSIWYKDIAKSKKSSPMRAEEVDNLQLLTHKIFELKQNTIVLFHIEWCHHCKAFLPIFEEASQYEITNQFSFIKINCKNKAICNQFQIDKYPTVKVFVKGNEIAEEPGRDLDSVLEIIDKLSRDPIVKLDDRAQLISMQKVYGENTPVVEYNDIEFVKCIDILANEKFKADFYFLEYPSDENRIIWNGSCAEIEKFIELNKFPVMRKLDSSYIKHLTKANKILISLVISLRNHFHFNLIETIFTQASLKYRTYVFTYIDIDRDAGLVNYFKIASEDVPKIIVYDFSARRFYVDTVPKEIWDDKSQGEAHVNEIIYQVETDTLPWATGNLFADFFYKHGIKITLRGVAYILGGCFLVIILLLIFLIFYCGASTESIPDQNSTSSQCEELTNDQKKNQ